MEIPVPKKRGKSFTVMGAIGECLKNNGYFSDEARTEGVAFRLFIKELKENHVKEEFAKRKPYLLLDNHPCHRMDKSKRLL